MYPGAELNADNQRWTRGGLKRRLQHAHRILHQYSYNHSGGGTCSLLEKPCVCHRAREERAAAGRVVGVWFSGSAGGATSFMPLPTSSVPGAAFFFRCRCRFGLSVMLAAQQLHVDRLRFNVS